jgi:ribosomal protein S18 acetylase RimI-like enzyme
MSAVTLRPLHPDEFGAWLRRSAAEYAGDLTAQGVPADEAERQANEGMAGSFPGGVQVEGHEVMNIVAESGLAVGYLWIGRDLSRDPRSWWVWDIMIDADKRGLGLGRAAMIAGEHLARSRGAQSLGLSVFAFNSAARGLYESLGYETTSVKMKKRLQ